MHTYWAYLVPGRTRLPAAIGRQRCWLLRCTALPSSENLILLVFQGWRLVVPMGWGTYKHAVILGEYQILGRSGAKLQSCFCTRGRSNLRATTKLVVSMKQESIMDNRAWVISPWIFKLIRQTRVRAEYDTGTYKFGISGVVPYIRPIKGIGNITRGGS